MGVACGRWIACLTFSLVLDYLATSLQFLNIIPVEVMSVACLEVILTINIAFTRCHFGCSLRALDSMSWDPNFLLFSHLPTVSFVSLILPQLKL